MEHDPDSTIKTETHQLLALSSRKKALYINHSAIVNIYFVCYFVFLSASVYVDGRLNVDILHIHTISVRFLAFFLSQSLRFV